VTSVLAALSTAVVCARLLARFRLRSVGIDDWIIIATMVRRMKRYTTGLNLTVKAPGDRHVGLNMRR
jgi:hypothetical protein